ncbi:hypothetical protein CTZ27_31280 [Streptomyces griseocarneus]|nr:hypothetical protein CTZ27_31280 [Streptomyces griseocarneus]
MIPADAENKYLTVEDIAAIYKVAVTQVHSWTSMEGFPPGRPAGTARTLLVRDAGAVDAWLERNFRVYWAQGQDSDNPLGLPKGGDKDLLSLADIGKLEALVIGREKPVPAATLRGYISKGTMPAPDRTPDDKKSEAGEPVVTDRRWYRATVYQWLERPRQARRPSKSGTPSAATAPASGTDEEPVVSAAQEPQSLQVRQIASKYLVSELTVRNWAKRDGFPRMLPGTKTYDTAAVDRWVRENKKRAWAAAQEQLMLEASGTAAVAPAESASTSTARPAGAKSRSRDEPRVELTLRDIAQRFDQPIQTVRSWEQVKEKRERGKVVRAAFPKPCRTARPRAWDQDEVDAWVKETRQDAWASFAGTGPALLQPLPEGHPRDLLDVDDFRVIWGNARRGEPISRTTMHSYHSRGQIPFADRTPDDELTPEVFAYHWYRETVYHFIRSRGATGDYEAR